MLVYFSTVAYKPQRTLFQRSFDMDIQEVINPDTIVIRYGRTWRFSRPKMKDGFLVGKLGFTATGTEKRADYNEEIKDFIEQTVDSEQATFVFWATDLSRQILAFETKPPDIKYQSFRGAFQGVLNERSDIGLTLEGIAEIAQFVEWVGSVDRVTRFTANLRTPNPDYSKHAIIIRELLEDTNADRVRLELVKLKESTDSLDTEKTIKDIVEYQEEGYSSIIARGEKEKQLKIFDSRKKLPMEQIDVPDVIADDSKWELIIRALRGFIK
jgi:hypothetical protein